MPNIEITTKPTGRSPERKVHYGSRTMKLDLTRPKYNKIGAERYFWEFYSDFDEWDLDHNLVFYTCGMCFRVETNDDRHAQFVRNMFTVVDNPLEHCADWTILHNTQMHTPPNIAVNLNEHIMLIAGTTFLGEIKKGVFSILGFEMPEKGILPMHCAAFTSDDDNLSTNLMFGLSGTGKTTLSTKLIENFTKIGINVGTLKHAHHKFDIDKPGKDSYNLRKAGARPMIISSKERFALIQENDQNEEKSLFEMLEMFSKNPIKKCDIIIVEGYKNENIPKLEVYRPIIKKPLLFTEDKNIFAIATDSKIESSIPSLDLNNINSITDYIIQKYKIS